MPLSITRSFSFDAAHFLPSHEGKCKNLHGHTWRFEVEVEASTNHDNADPLHNDIMVMDFGDLKKMVNERILSRLDHTCLNDILTHPTAENIAMWIAHQVYKGLPNYTRLASVKVWESPDSHATWRKQI